MYTDEHTCIYTYTNIHTHKCVHIYTYNIHTEHTKHDKTEHIWKHTCIYIYIKPLKPNLTK